MKISARKLFYSLPPVLRFAVRRLYYLPADFWQALAGARDELTPPKGLIYTGSGDFKKSGERTVEYFKEFCGLQPDGHVLDVGSGIGRIAIPLTKYLSENGSYEGFDVVRQGVDWCREQVTARFPNFRFQYVPLDNDLYKTGGASASAFRFPYESERFDLVVLNSVFTHMLPDEVENYFGEISRVLKKGGVCYATFFLFQRNEPHFPEGFEFPFDYGHYRLMDEKVKSANVAFDESYLRQELIEKFGFGLRHLFYGFWRGLPKGECKDFQDLIILEKK